ncbi:MAG: hypothetical protein HPY57_12845 [Ignavibacteria bacterium]|nr:hypothetical protein [Ignavibacteria bacterium]
MGIINLAILIIFISLAGIARGIREVIQFKYNDFKETFPNINDNWWNPRISWKNKYKDNNPSKGPKFFLSTTSLVFITDAYHFLATLSHFLIAISISYFAFCLTNHIIYSTTGIIWWIVYSFLNHITINSFEHEESD